MESVILENCWQFWKMLNINILWHKDFTPEYIPNKYKCLHAPKDICKMLMVTLFIIVKNCKLQKYPSKIEWINKIYTRNTTHQKEQITDT